jgi:ATP-dependent protease HslVU (ClpYQ) peptidase subunit
MTIIATLDCDDHLLLAADSQVTDSSGYKLTKQKLDSIDSQRVAWGFAGNESVGYQFGDWLRAWNWPSDATWKAVIDASIEEVSRLNGRQRQLCKLAGIEAGDNNLADVLIAGIIGGRLDAFVLSSHAEQPISVRRDPGSLTVIGTGAPYAIAAYEAIKMIKPKAKPDAKTLRAVLEVSAKVAPLCGLPIRVLRMDASGIIET